MKNTTEISVDWKGNLQFDAQVNGHTLTLDVPVEKGGGDKGPRPKPLMLVALAGCTGIDVVSILSKMRVEIEGLSIRVEAQQSDDHPIHYTAINIIYEFKGKDLQKDKLEKAINLSQERYCGVSAVYQKVMPISSEIRIENI